MEFLDFWNPYMGRDQRKQGLQHFAEMWENGEKWRSTWDGKCSDSSAKRERNVVSCCSSVLTLSARVYWPVFIVELLIYYKWKYSFGIYFRFFSFTISSERKYIPN